jgi:hypothetical protein
MNTSLDNLKTFLNQIKAISLFDRLFRWRKVKEMYADALVDLQRVQMALDHFGERNGTLSIANFGLTKDVDLARIKIADLETSLKLSLQKAEFLSADNTDHREKSAEISETLKQVGSRKNALEIELERLSINYNNLEEQRDLLKYQNTQLMTEEDMRRNKHEQDINTLNAIREKIEKDRAAEVELLHQQEISRLEDQKSNWKIHEDDVKQTLRTICSKHNIDYVEKAPFKGEPDNLLKIANEYVVFDAKSPKGDDLSNFPTYLQKQTEEVKKYSRQENVKRWLFFVIPSNCYAVIRKSVYNLSDYDVFIVTRDALEPIIVSLKKIEEYELVDQLSPLERENICRIIGKFAHLSKRRIQIDLYFIRQFLELAYKSEAEIPPDILEEVKDFEKAEMLNPPLEKRSKAISVSELEKDALRIKNEAANQGIVMHDEALSEEINKLPLYIQEGKN